MPPVLVVNVDDAALMTSLRALIVRGSDPRPALERIADDFLQMERRQFATAGAASGTPWQPLSPAWEARKRGTSILVGSSRRLQNSLVRQGTRGSRRQITRQSLTVGSRHPLAHLHQTGTEERFVRSWRGKPLAKPRSAGRLPSRPVVAVGLRDEQRWRGILADYIIGEHRSLGL